MFKNCVMKVTWATTANCNVLENFPTNFFTSIEFLACQFLWLLPLTVECLVPGLTDRILFTAIMFSVSGITINPEDKVSPCHVIIISLSLSWLADWLHCSYQTRSSQGFYWPDNTEIKHNKYCSLLYTIVQYIIYFINQAVLGWQESSLMVSQPCQQFYKTGEKLNWAFEVWITIN